MIRNPIGRRTIGVLMKVGARLGAHGPGGIREVARLMNNGPYLIRNELTPFLAFDPDYEALKAVEFPIVIGVGAESRQYYPARAAAEVANRLGAAPVEFPGAHAGYTDKSAKFAVVLRETLTGLREPAH